MLFRSVQNSEVPYMRCLIGWIAKTFDYINRVKLTLPLSVYEGTWTNSPPLASMHLLDRSCVIVGIFLKLYATFPNWFLRSSLLLFWMVWPQLGFSSSLGPSTKVAFIDVVELMAIHMSAHMSACGHMERRLLLCCG